MTTIALTSNRTPTYFDLDAALDRCCGDENFLAEMGELLVHSVKTQLTVVDAAVASQSAAQLRAASHALKGAVASMTTARPYELTYRLEMLGASGTCDHAESLVAELRQSLDQLLSEIREWSEQRTL